MNLQEKLTALESKRKKIIDLKNEVITDSSELFDAFVKDIFERHPKLESFGWSQYTPYFNDGETCVFYANIDYLYINGNGCEDSEWYSDVNVVNWGTWNSTTRKYEGREEVPNPNYDPELKLACDELSQFLSNFDHDFYLNKFGDHTIITINSSGISVEEYEHD
jgi:hypothetical protein